MLAGFLLTLAITVINARGRVFWEDEMLGWQLLRDPSWRHMIHAWNVGADGGGFSFYLLGRAWFRVFGASVLSFRLFSSTCFGLAFGVLWAALRRGYPLGIVAFAALNTFFFSPPLTQHFLEGRFYGLLVLSTAAALWLVLRLEDAPQPTPPHLLLGVFLVHGLLTTSHVLGVIFSAALLAATVWLDRLQRRWRAGLYLTVGAAWLLLLPERRSIMAAGRVGQPHFWTAAPTARQIVGGFTGFSTEILLVLLALLLLAVVTLAHSPFGFRAALREEFQRHRALYVATVCLLLVPVAFLGEGLAGTWLFTDRYLQPVTLGVACVTAELAGIAASLSLLQTLQGRWPRASLAARFGAATGFAALLLYWVFHHVAMNTPQPVDFTGALTAHLPHDLPVVVEDAFTFTELMSDEAGSGVHYVYLLDWPYSVSPEAPRLEVTQYHLMQNWKRAGYFADHIEDLQTFLRANPRFLVIHDGLIQPDPHVKPEIGNPLTARLAGDPAFTVRPFFVLDRRFHDSHRDTVSLVCRGGCDPAPTRAATAVATASAASAAKPAWCVLLSAGRTRCRAELPAP